MIFFGNIRSHLLEIVLAVLCILAFIGLVAAIAWRSFWLNYQLFVPREDMQEQRPVLVVLHGRSGNISDLRTWLGFDEFAEKYNFLVIYPQSNYDAWDFGVGVTIRGNTARRYVDHTQYILNIIDRVGQRHNIDRKRLYLVGVSDGVSMAMRMSCSTNNVFRAIASVAATLAVHAVDNCTYHQPMKVLLVHGTADTVMPWDGKRYKQYSVFMSMQESVAWWHRRNGCGSTLLIDEKFEQLSGSVDHFHMAGCEQGTSIDVIRVNDGGHSWPGRNHPANRTTGPVNHDIDLTEIISEWIAEDE